MKASEASVGSKGTVLVVDDSGTNRLLLTSILKNDGYEIFECADGRQCLDYCTSSLPDLILLDVMMPDLDGIEVCRSLREKHSKQRLPIIMVTIAAEGADVQAGIQAGANDYVIKPVDHVALLARLENQLLMSKSHREMDRQRRLLERSLEIQNAMGDVLPEALMVHDGEGRIIYYNQRFRDQCCHVRPRDLQEALRVSFEQQLVDAHSQIYELIMADPLRSIEHEIEVRGEELTNIRIISKPIEESEGTLLRLWLWQDLSALRDLERRINQQVKLDTVALFASGVAHNFNNLMGAILGVTALLKRMAKDDRRMQRCIEVIETAIGAGKKLTRKMATLVQREWVVTSGPRDDLAEVIRCVCDCQRELVGERIRFILELAEDLPAIRMDGMNITDIVSNVVSNAVDAIPEQGEVRINSSYHKGAEELLLTVVDNGVGMDQYTLARVYEPFFSTKNLDQRNGVSMEGNGLGLWSVYSLLKACGGGVEIESLPKRGTSVRLSLPILDRIDV